MTINNYCYVIIVSIVFLCGLINSTGYDNLPLVEKAFSNRVLHNDSKKGLFTRGNKEDVLVGWFLSNDEIGKLTELLVSEFKNEISPLDPRDKNIIKALRNNLAGYQIWEPLLIFKEPYSGYSGVWQETPVYIIAGWNKFKLDITNDAALRKFIKLFLAGAHFVVVGPNKLVLEIKSLPHAAKNFKHSHYKETPNALVYPAITWKTRSPTPIISALLIDQVKLLDTTIGTFFQLEGWPVHRKSDTLNDTVLHGKDFLLHARTLWNISTYGMSPYSEKRGTTVFITKDNMDEKELNKLAKKTFKLDYTNYAEDRRN